MSKSKRMEAIKWLEEWAGAAGGSLDDLLDKLASFSLGDDDVFVYRNQVVGLYELDASDEDYDADAAVFKPDEDSGYDLQGRGWSGDHDHALWTHYKALTGVSPWDKDCRGC